MRYRSWGFVPEVAPAANKPAWPCESIDRVIEDGASCLPFGNGRSYGDSCLTSDGTLIDTGSLDRFIQFDRELGVLTVEAGVTIASILSRIVPAGWFLPVTPGTSHVTVGGAIANDVHGKNHHRDGTFGRFVRRMSVLRSDEGRLECSPDNHAQLYAATIGGLGLTGLILDATIQLIPIQSPLLDVKTDTFVGLESFVQLSHERNKSFQYSVAWIDCVSRQEPLGRGLLFSANHAHPDEYSKSVSDTSSAAVRSTTSQWSPRVSVPMNLPSRLINRRSMALFNAAYFKYHSRLNGQTGSQHYRPFFYPLDAIGQWNRIYGSGGFHQYQFVVPLDRLGVMQWALQRIAEEGFGSFLAVLKVFGDVPSPGMLSFPREGICLALDFANRGNRTVDLINELDRGIREAGGAAYPAKDRLMSKASFTRYFPAWERFASHVDPRFQSDFWRRVYG